MEIRPCVTVVVVTYASADRIADCLASVQEHAAGWVAECRVVDNDSPDETAQIVAGQFPDVKLFAQRENLGYARAVNLAAKDISTEYLMILNPDARLQPDAAAEMVRFLDHRREAGICGPRVTDAGGRFQPACRRGFPTPWNTLGYFTRLDKLMPYSRIWSGYHLRSVPTDREARIEVLAGSCFLIRNELYRRIDGFDEEYFLYGEDIDLCWKVRDAGQEIWFLPSAHVIHFKGSSMKKAPDISRRAFYRSMNTYIDKRLRDRYPAPLRAMLKLGVTTLSHLDRLRPRT